MKIAMFTNAYQPIIGGVEQSIATFVEDLRALGHDLRVITLAVPGAEQSDEHTLRLPAIKEVSGTEFSAKLPVPAGLSDELDAFDPDVIHSHHPFMLGDTALRMARMRERPIVFTHHTLYERYTYQFSPDSEFLERIAMALATEYANLCGQVIAPTRSIERLIRKRGVETPMEVIPTGVDIDAVADGDRAGCRRRHGIPEDAFVLGYLGRVVEAKNMDFLAAAAARVLTDHPHAWYLVVGDGECVEPMKQRFAQAGVDGRVVMTGSLTGPDVADAYAAMDLFAFASQTETQGIVQVESFCAGVPIVALDTPGARDIVEDGLNGRLLPAESTPEAFSQAISEAEHDREQRARWCEAARERAQDFERRHCARRLAQVYQRLSHSHGPSRADELDTWTAIQNRFAAEWDLFKEKVAAVAAASRI